MRAQEVTQLIRGSASNPDQEGDNAGTEAFPGARWDGVQHGSCLTVLVLTRSHLDQGGSIGRKNLPGPDICMTSMEFGGEDYEGRRSTRQADEGKSNVEDLADNHPVRRATSALTRCNSSRGLNGLTT